MPTMNETSTITLPEYHNLLALLLLSLNTPSVSSSSTTQEEEMIKKRKKRDNAHTESGARQQKSRSSSTRSRQRSRPYTQDTPSKRETSVTPKKERQTKPVYHHEHANTNHTPERRITPTITQPTQNPKTKKKNHTTHSPRSQPRNLATTQPPHRHTSNPSHILPSYIPAVTHSYTLSAYRPHAY